MENSMEKLSPSESNPGFPAQMRHSLLLAPSSLEKAQHIFLGWETLAAFFLSLRENQLQTSQQLLPLHPTTMTLRLGHQDETLGSQESFLTWPSLPPFAVPGRL